MCKWKIFSQGTVKIIQAVGGRVGIGIQVSSVSGVAPSLHSLYVVRAAGETKDNRSGTARLLLGQMTFSAVG